MAEQRRGRPTTKKITAKEAVKKAPLQPKTPLSKPNRLEFLRKIRMNTPVRIAALLAIVTAIFLLNPQAGLINQDQTDNPDNKQVYKLDIRNRVLSDPKEGDLTVRVGSRSVLQITTDEDGRINLISEERNVFNPVFSNISNTLSIPTDRTESFRIEFHPTAADPNSSGTTIGTVIVKS